MLDTSLELNNGMVFLIYLDEENIAGWNMTAEDIKELAYANILAYCKPRYYRCYAPKGKVCILNMDSSMVYRSCGNSVILPEKVRKSIYQEMGTTSKTGKHG